MAAAVVAAVAADTEPDTRMAVAADVQMALAVLLLQVTPLHTTLRTSRLTLLEQQQPLLTQYQHSRGPIRLRLKAV